MSALVTKLREQRLQTWEQAKAAAEAAAEEKRSMTGEEERQWDEANSELSKLDERVAELAKTNFGIEGEVPNYKGTMTRETANV